MHARIENRTLSTSGVVAVVLGLVVLGSAAVAIGSNGGPGVQSVTVGHGPVSLTVDQHTGWVAVANYLDSSVSLLGAGDGGSVTTATVDPRPTIVLIAPLARRIFTVTNSAAASGHDTVTVLDARGHRLQTIVVGNGASAATLDQHMERLYVANGADNTVSTIDMRSGRVLRTSPVLPGPIVFNVDERLGRIFVLSYGPTIEGDPVGRSSVTALDARTGTVLWTTVVGHEAKSVAMDGRGHLFVANSSDNTVSMVESRTGRILRTMHVGNRPSALAINERTGLLVTANSGDDTLTMIDTLHGTVNNTLHVGDIPIAVATDEPRNRVVLLLVTEIGLGAIQPSRGRVEVLDGRTGDVLRAVQTGLNPRALAVDQATERVFVANMLGSPAAESPLSTIRRWGQRWLPWWPASAPQPPPSTTGSLTIFDM